MIDIGAGLPNHGAKKHALPRNLARNGAICKKNSGFCKICKQLYLKHEKKFQKHSY